MRNAGYADKDAEQALKEKGRRQEKKNRIERRYNTAKQRHEE